MITAIIQARNRSQRLAGKVFADLCGYPLLWHIVDRLKHSKRVESIVVATSVEPSDDLIEEWALQNSMRIFRGSENDVLHRFYEAAKKFRASVIVRVTADDPFKDPVIIDQVIETFLSHDVDFVYNNHPPTYPEGLDVEVFSFQALECAAEEATEPFDREHVTQYFYRNKKKFRQMNVPYKRDLSYLRWTIDTEPDLQMAKAVYSKLFHPDKIFLMADILQLLEQHPEIMHINMGVERSAMYKQMNHRQRVF